MKYTYKVWDKKEYINGVPAEQIKRELYITPQDDIFLILNEFNVVTEIQFASTIQSNYDMKLARSTDAIAQEYIKIKESEEAKSKECYESAEKSAQERLKALEEGLANAEYAMMMGGLL